MSVRWIYMGILISILNNVKLVNRFRKRVETDSSLGRSVIYQVANRKSFYKRNVERIPLLSGIENTRYI